MLHKNMILITVCLTLILLFSCTDTNSPKTIDGDLPVLDGDKFFPDGDIFDADSSDSDLSDADSSGGDSDLDMQEKELESENQVTFGLKDLPGSLAFIRDVFISEDEYSDEIILIENGKRTSILKWELWMTSFCWSPDKKQMMIYAEMSPIAGFYMLDIESGNTTTLIKHTGSDPLRWGFVPDTSKIWMEESPPFSIGINIIELEPEAFIRELIAGKHAALAPNGKILAYVNPVGMIRKLELSNPDEFNTIIGGDWPAWSPDEKYLAYVADSFINLYELNTGKHYPISDSLGSPSGLMFSPSGDRILYLAGSTLYTIQTKEPHSITIINPALSIAGINFTWSPDGRFIAWESIDGTNTSLMISRSTGGEPLSLSDDIVDPFDFAPVWK